MYENEGAVKWDNFIVWLPGNQWRASQIANLFFMWSLLSLYGGNIEDVIIANSLLSQLQNDNPNPFYPTLKRK